MPPQFPHVPPPPRSEFENEKNAQGYTRISCNLDRMDLNHIAALLRTLSPSQEKVVRLYFGLGCQHPHSASAIAREFQVSSQVISGILGGAQRRLAQLGLTPRKLRDAAFRQFV